jgi:hypothetical protein
LYCRLGWRDGHRDLRKGKQRESSPPYNLAGKCDPSTHKHMSSPSLILQGVSTDIHVSYLSSAKLGDELVITATADKVGGSLAYTSIR